MEKKDTWHFLSVLLNCPRMGTLPGLALKDKPLVKSIHHLSTYNAWHYPIQPLLESVLLHPPPGKTARAFSP